MSVMMPAATDLNQRLFQLATRRRRLHEHPLVIVPVGREPLPRDLLFTGDGPAVLELGSGSGEFAIRWILEHPDINYVAFEVKGDRIKKTLKAADRNEITNLRIIPVNFNWFLTEILPARSFNTVIVNFPDPWPKRRHHKHRLVNSAFPERIAALLTPGGFIHLATDYGPYARRMLGAFRRSPLFEPLFPFPNYMRERPEGFPETKFEKLHRSEGKRPYYQQWRLTDAAKN
jgi:tRNA (guanine-N7-)-methyltransferase